MQVPLSVQLMQLIVSHCCCGEGMSFDVDAELRAATEEMRVGSGCHGTNLGEFVDDSNRDLRRKPRLP